MTNKLSTGVQRVQQALQRKGFPLKIVELAASTRTAKDAASAIGCSVEQIVKSLIFRTCETHRPILIVASGSNRVNEEMLAELIGEAIERPDANFVREQTGFAVGGVAPIGHSKPLETFIDEDLLQFEIIWAAAGTPFAVFQLTPNELIAMTEGKIIAIHN